MSTSFETGDVEPNVPPVPLLELQGFGDKRTWNFLKESGPLHAHAPVYVPPSRPDTVLKEYPKRKLEDAMDEATRLSRAHAFMPRVYAVYYDEEYVYIHMERLAQTVMSKIEQEGIAFVLENKTKFETLWNTTTLIDSSSMCRVDNMMLDDSGEVKFIDAEKADEVIDGLSLEDRNRMIVCFIDSVLSAHLTYLAVERGLDLEDMGRLYIESGSRFIGSVKKKQFTLHFAKTMLRWFEKYEAVYQSMKREIEGHDQILRSTFGIGPDRRGYSFVWLKTQYKEAGETSFKTITF